MENTSETRVPYISPTSLATHQVEVKPTPVYTETSTPTATINIHVPEVFCDTSEFEPRPVAPDIETEKDLYYAMNIFSLWAEADYEIKGCYEVSMTPTYRFYDSYDWHEGLPAGGAVPALGGFKDEWVAALHDAGLALEYEITGYWEGRARLYI